MRQAARLILIGLFSGVLSIFSMRGYCGLDSIPGWNGSCMFIGPGFIFGALLSFISGIVKKSWSLKLLALTCSVIGYGLAVQIAYVSGHEQPLSFIKAGGVGAAIFAIGIFLPLGPARLIKSAIVLTIAGAILGAAFYQCLNSNGFATYFAFGVWQTGILLLLNWLVPKEPGADVIAAKPPII